MQQTTATNRSLTTQMKSWIGAKPRTYAAAVTLTGLDQTALISD